MKREEGKSGNARTWTLIPCIASGWSREKESEPVIVSPSRYIGREAEDGALLKSLRVAHCFFFLSLRWNRCSVCCRRDGAVLGRRGEYEGSEVTEGAIEAVSLRYMSEYRKSIEEEKGVLALWHLCTSM